jgi:hypothetical protein
MIVNIALVSETVIVAVKTYNTSLRGEVEDVKRLVLRSSYKIASEP